MGGTQAPRELQLTPDGDPRLLSRPDDRRQWGEPRGDHEQVHGVGQGVAVPQPDGRTEDVEDLCALLLAGTVTGVDGRDPGTQRQKRISRSEPRDADAGHSHVDAAPVRVPDQVVHHHRTHSA